MNCWFFSNISITLQGTICCFSIYDETYLDYASGDIYKCTKPGEICKNCNQTKVCIDLGGGDFDELDGDECDIENKEYCLNGNCTNATNQHCPPREQPAFPCKSIGVFPDPFDCQVFHVCCEDEANSSSSIHNCENKFAYDPLTTYCKIPLSSNICPERPPVPTCTRSGERGALTMNKTIYFICTKINGVLYPVQYLCPNGRYFVGDQCVNKM